MRKNDYIMAECIVSKRTSNSSSNGLVKRITCGNYDPVFKKYVYANVNFIPSLVYVINSKEPNRVNGTWGSIPSPLGLFYSKDFHGAPSNGRVSCESVPAAYSTDFESGSGYYQYIGKIGAYIQLYQDQFIYFQFTGRSGFRMDGAPFYMYYIE